MCREYTPEEIRDMFLDTVCGMIKYWDGIENYTPEQKLKGFAFSILADIDGCDSNLPSFILAPFPHESDKDYAKEYGNKWFPQNHKLEKKIRGDISGTLHEEFHKYWDKKYGSKNTRTET